MLYFGTDDADGVIGFEMQTFPDEGGDVGWDIVVGMIEEVAGGVGVVAGGG